MPTRIKPSPAMAVALLALFISLAGGAYAATSLPRNSVGTAQLRDQAVTVHKLAFDSVGTRRIFNHAVTNAKIADNAVGTFKIRESAIGPRRLQDNAVTSAKVMDGSLQASDFASGQLPPSASFDFETGGTTIPTGSTVALPNGGTIDVPAGTHHMVLFGTVQLQNPSTTGGPGHAGCQYDVNGQPFPVAAATGGFVGTSVPAGQAGQISLVARVGVTEPHQVIQVRCQAQQQSVEALFANVAVVVTG